MKIGDGSKPFSPLGGAQAKTAQAAERTLGALADAAGKALRVDAAAAVDRFEKAAAPAFQALLGSARATGSAAADAGAALLGGLRAQLGRAESDTRTLMRQAEALRSARDGTGKGAGDLGTALLDGLAAVADALARAQEATAAESTLESMIGRAGRLLRADTARDVENLGNLLDELKAAAGGGKAVAKASLTGARWAVEREVAAGGEAIDDLRSGLARVENDVRQILRQIEALRTAETEQGAADPGAGEDGLAAVGQSVSDAYAAIRDLLD